MMDREQLLNKTIRLSTHFPEPVKVVSITQVGNHYKLIVRKEDVSAEKWGFDIRSLGPADPKTGYREVRRIEVKGRKKAQNIQLTLNEWLKAKQLKDTYWLYVAWNPTDLPAKAMAQTEDNYKMIRILDPANKLEYAAKEIRAISHYEIPAGEIQKISRGD